MEVLNGVVANSSSCYYITRIQKSPKSSSFSNSKACFRRENGLPEFKKLVAKVGNNNNNGFEDEGHVAYYSRVYCGEKKGNNNNKSRWGGISTKKRMKLLKGLVNDLSTFSDLGFGLDFNCDNQVGVDDKSMAISQASEILLAQLKQLRAAEEEMKKMEKEEEMKKMEKEGETKKMEKEDAMKKCKSQDCESSSSSSESSDSECDEVIDMKCMKNKAVVQPIEAKESTMTTMVPGQGQSASEQLSENSEQKCCNMILEMTLNKDAGIEVLGSDSLVMNQSKVAGMEERKIEVCMGGKCKKLGSPALMDEFQRVMGDNGVVVGCKCLGKCKSAPNVRVSNVNVADNVGGDDSLRTPSNAICVGVGLEDVGLIVSNYFGEDSKEQLSVAIAGV